MLDSTAAVLQVLPGRRLHVFIALVSLQHVLPVGERDVAKVAGCHRHTAVSHLEALEVLGLVTRGAKWERQSWTLTAVSYQLPLPGLGLGAGPPALKESNFERKESKTSTLSLSSSSISKKRKKVKKEEEEEEPKESKTSTVQFEHKPGLLAALQDSGIGRNAWEKLAGYEWVTADYVKAHTWLRKKNKDPIGYQVQRMRSGDAMPIMPVTAVCHFCGHEVSESMAALTAARGFKPYCTTCYYDERIEKEWTRQ